MFDSNVYDEGRLIVGKMTGVIEPQSFINGMFWQIDSCNVGEVQPGFSQLYYDCDVESVQVTEEDIRRIAEINTGIGINVGTFRTALVIQHPEVRRLALLHQRLAKEHGLEVELFDNLKSGFSWLNHKNPDPDLIKLV